MNIAFIGFGKVSYNLTKIIKSSEINFITSAEKRSKKTCELIKKSDIEVYKTFRQAIENADIIISAVTPAKAIETAQKYGKNFNGIYLDLNNISPKSTLTISEIVDNFVDGAIIGKIDSENPILYLSGFKAKELLFLNEFLNVKIISDNAGDASKLKMLRSSYTKALSLLLIESHTLAKNLKLEDEFFEVLSLTEGDDFSEKSLSRINNTLTSSKRKSEEIEEILNEFNHEDLSMLRTAYEKLKQF